MDRVQATGNVKVRKRKAESHDNERLSKRLSLLNLAKELPERDGQKLYVPVEQPAINSPPPNPRSQPKDDDVMQLDDSKHKVYIYDIDAELSDSSDSEDGKLVFLPDIEKHLKASRIPPSVLANSEGELAGNNLELVLYNVPSSLTVPEEKDSVRKAIIESRARAREKQARERDGQSRDAEASVARGKGLDPGYWYRHTVNANRTDTPADVKMEAEPTAPALEVMGNDPDAMELG